MNIQIRGLEFAQDNDSYWRVRSLTSVLTAVAAAKPVAVASRMAISIARNMRERKVGKSRSRRVGKCLGFNEIAPVVGSITILCRDESAPETIIPFVEPGAAKYGSRFGSGVWTTIEIAGRFLLRRHFFTRISSCEKDHSSAESSVTAGALVGFGLLVEAGVGAEVVLVWSGELVDGLERGIVELGEEMLCVWLCV